MTRSVMGPRSAVLVNDMVLRVSFRAGRSVRRPSRVLDGLSWAGRQNYTPGSVIGAPTNDGEIATLPLGVQQR